MYKLNRLDMGLTTRCNAACPQCPRTNAETNKGWDWLKLEELTLEDIQKIVPPQFFKDNLILTISICGGYGDPLLASELFPILEYFFQYANKADIFIATNGAMKKPVSWWHRLGKLLAKAPRRVEVTFGLDGINQEMHAAYRVHTDFDVALRNAQILRMYNVEVCWQYIMFDHNYEYVDQAREMAKKYHFTRFSPITSTRTPIMDISPPNEIKELYTTRGASYNLFTNNENYDIIKCISEEAREVHIHCDGYIVPCCFLDERYFMMKYKREHMKVHGVPEKDLIELKGIPAVDDIFELYGSVDIEIFNAKERGLQAVVDDPWWDTFLEKRDQFKIHKCNDICGKCSTA